jgi:hypothetical protein
VCVCVCVCVCHRVAVKLCDVWGTDVTFIATSEPPAVFIKNVDRRYVPAKGDRLVGSGLSRAVGAPDRVLPRRVGADSFIRLKTA